MPSTLNSRSTVLDLGAHKGEFSARIRERFSCRCIAVEANPALVEKIRTNKGIEVEWAAVTDHEGEIDFILSENPEASTVMKNGGSSSASRQLKVPARTLESLLKQFNTTHIDVLKLDVEGAEVPIILSTPDRILQSIDQITVEFHDFCGLISSEQLSSVCERLESLGFESMRFAPSDNMNWLFVRRGIKGIGPLRLAYVKQLVRTARNSLHSVRSLTGARLVGLSNE